MATTDADIEIQVRHSLLASGVDLGDFDIPGIVEEIIAGYGLVPIDVIDYGPYWALIARHDISQQ